MNSKQTTFVLQIQSDKFLNGGSVEVHKALQVLRDCKLDVKIIKTYHGSLPESFRKEHAYVV